MLTFEMNRGRFNFRVAGIAIHRERVLLHRSPAESFWSLPGGRGELMEATTTTLKREMREELESDVQVERLLWVVENFYHYENRDVHELCFYYLMHFPAASPILAQTEGFIRYDNRQPILFQWLHLHDLRTVELYPSFLKEDLKELPAMVVHKVHRDVDH